MTVGFVGFGEAASSIAEGLREEGIEELYCYDAMQEQPDFGEKIVKKCKVSGVRILNTAAEVCWAAEVIIVAVPSAFAQNAAKEALNGIHPGNVYVDVTTASPAEKRKISGWIEEKGGAFVDAAMLGTLLKDRHKVPMLLCGSGAAGFLKKMEPYHMNLTLVEGDPGVATGIKFIRSITAKGLSCLLFESLQASQKLGVEEIIVESFLDSFGPGFEKIINGYLSGAIIHAKRREHEMRNVVDFLMQEDLPCTMAEATREKLKWIDNENIKDDFEGEVGRNWKDVLSGWKL